MLAFCSKYDNSSTVSEYQSQTVLMEIYIFLLLFTLAHPTQTTAGSGSNFLQQ